MIGHATLECLSCNRSLTDPNVTRDEHESKFLACKPRWDEKRKTPRIQQVLQPSMKEGVPN